MQVTRFPADEGFILGVAHSHIVADGTSLWHFLKSWGECTRGVPLSMHPVHMREAFGPDNLILPPPCAEEDKGNGFFEMLEADSGKNNLVQRDFHFTSEMVTKLKQMANDSLSAEHKPFSSLQAVTAHIWRHVIAVTDLDKNEKSIFFVIANMRSRLNPPLPEGYFGNAIIRDGAIARKEELQGESLGATALRIKELIDSLDDTKTRSFYGKVEVLPFEKVLEGIDFSMFSLQVSSSPRFPVYDVDFGLGKPLCARCPFIHGAGEMMWFPGKDAGSIDIGFALPKFIMEKLEQDDRFLHF
ncbi:hypothetical protein KP509_06G038300 [Ceratopteris richardii]|uniref:Uncharacterized protein n=1 Tax=Ceratopteris richardii TaxID=49495 RepID=A0A8T2URT4_CERRI|nr:hypothetical protein KP509_06G038300 [Ceratopteris richardii]